MGNTGVNMGNTGVKMGNTRCEYGQHGYEYWQRGVNMGGGYENICFVIGYAGGMDKEVFFFKKKG